MTQGTTAYGGTFALEINDGNSPASFVTVGGYKSKNLSLTANTSTEQVPDNDVPDSAVWDSNIATSLSAGVDASGMMTAEVLPLIDAWFASGLARNVRLVMAAPPALAGRTYAFSALLTKNNLGATIQKKITHDISLKADGAVVITPS